MGINIKDITDVFPFILKNLPMTAYIIIVSIVLGFWCGKKFEKIRRKRKIIDLKSQLSNKEEFITKVNIEKEQLEKKIQEISAKYEMLQNKTEIAKAEQTKSMFASLSVLEKMLNSKEGQVELTALIELNCKKEKDAQKVEN